MSSAAPQDNRSPPKRAAERSESRGLERKNHSPEILSQRGSDAFQVPSLTGLPTLRQMGTSSSPSKHPQPGHSPLTGSQVGREEEPQARNPTPGGPKPRERKSHDLQPSIPRAAFNLTATSTAAGVILDASSSSVEGVLAEDNLDSSPSFHLELEVDGMGRARIRKSRKSRKELDEMQAGTEANGPRDISMGGSHQITYRTTGSMAPPPLPVGPSVARSSSVGDRHSAIAQFRGVSLPSGPGLRSTFGFASSGLQWYSNPSARSQMGARPSGDLTGSPFGGHNHPIRNYDPGRQPIPGRRVAQNFTPESSRWGTIDEAEEHRRQQIFDQFGDVNQHQAVSSGPRAQSANSFSRANAGIGSHASQPLFAVSIVPKRSDQPSSPQVKIPPFRTEATILRDLMALGSRLGELNEHYQVRRGEKNYGLFDTIFEKFVEDACNILTLDMVCGDIRQADPCPKAQELADKIIEDLPRLSNADYDDFDSIVALELRHRVALVYKAVLEREGGTGVFKWSC